MIAAHKDCDKFIICNGNEDEPGTFQGSLPSGANAAQVIEGALIAAVATGANHVVIYVNPHERRAVGAELAVHQWQSHTLLADTADGVAARCPQYAGLRGLYIGGKETAVISTI